MTFLPFKNLKIALISDDLTRSCLTPEANIFNITPWNYKIGLKHWKPDLLFVESAWNGYLNSWKYKIASYPNRKTNKNKHLEKVVNYAQNLGIKCVFWNKEDNVHFERFISSASLFDYILTVDENCINKYKQAINRDIKVASLLFAVQPSIHYFKDFNYQYKKVSFVGSYNKHQHDKRRDWQDLLFSASTDFGLDIYDRRSNKKSDNFKFPDYPSTVLKNRVSHHKTGDVYRAYIANLNVNTVTDSKTMFSRRLIEIMACGRLVITNPADSIDQYFHDYCSVVHNQEELLEIYAKLKQGYSKIDKEKIREGSELILNNHTYTHRIKEILAFIK